MARLSLIKSAVLLCAFMTIPFRVFAQPKVAPHKPDADEYAIYSVIANTQFNWKGVTQIVILDRTGMPGCLTSEMNDGERQFGVYLRKTVPGVRADTATDFYGKARETGLLENELHLSLPYSLLSDQDESTIFSSHGNGWKGFYQKYPGAQGTLFFSPIGFDSARHQALVYFGDQSNYLGGAGYLTLLTKEKDTWVIVKRNMLWIS